MMFHHEGLAVDDYRYMPHKFRRDLHLHPLHLLVDQLNRKDLLPNFSSMQPKAGLNHFRA
jgi:hypothetical protein